MPLKMKLSALINSNATLKLDGYDIEYVSKTTRGWRLKCEASFDTRFEEQEVLLWNDSEGEIINADGQKVPICAQIVSHRNLLPEDVEGAEDIP